MSTVATYSFMPYLRQGIANNMQSTGGARGVFTVKLDVHGDALKEPVKDKDVEIYGPGDIIGIDARSVVKTDPYNGITNFESNYLPYIDFYDEDYPWRYTPVPPAGQRLNPWLTLVVLAQDEFSEGRSSPDGLLPYFTIKDASQKDKYFPKTDQLWAWAHVHFNGDLMGDKAKILIDAKTDVDAALDRLQSALDENPDFAYSRLICPRKLKSSTDYHAFLIPSYESGRLAGTGSSATDIANAKLSIAWETVDEKKHFPYYYRWAFSTGTMGDFEYLVRLLKPKVADSRVGRRVMDMTLPKGNVVWKEDDTHPLGGILRLGGALKVPAEALTEEEISKMSKFDEWAVKNFPELHPFQVRIAGFLNLADDYNINASQDANAKVAMENEQLHDPNEDADPLITPPIYGRWHARVERVFKDRTGNRIDNNYNWLNELNLDPRFRVPAHFGTRVVQENQEEYMESAWEQIGEVLKANRQIRFGQYAIAAGAALHAKHLAIHKDGDAPKILLLTAPLQKRLMYSGSTMFQQTRMSVLPGSMLSAPMRRIVRPRGRLATHLERKLPEGESLRLETVVTKINAGELLPAPPKSMPSGLPSVDTVASELEPRDIPVFVKDLIKKYPWLVHLPLIIAILLLLIILLAGPSLAAISAAVVIAGALVYFWRKMLNWKKELDVAESMKAMNRTPQSVDAMPKSSDFRLTSPEEKITPSPAGNTDSVHAAKFKESLKDMYRLHTITRRSLPAEKPKVSLELTEVADVVINQLRPEKTVPAWTWQHVFFPGWLKDQQVYEEFAEIMGYPKINRAMYADLKKISDELFLPNVHLIEQNSLTLLETNQKFIESYMVGLNHEFARELLWREYPTDQMGSYFRQFWDITGVLKDPALAGKPESEQREPYYDITKIHEWRRASKLGDHDNRQKPGEPKKEEVVLVIRGELLKKYPTAVVYAHKAAWSPLNGEPDIRQPRSLSNAEEGDKEKPDREYVRTPLYSAKVDPDIYFFGFDLTTKEVRGESRPENPNADNAGWFFVIKERAGEPRFGFDIPATDGSSNNVVTWNDVDWGDVIADTQEIIDPLKVSPSIPAIPDPPINTSTTEGKGQKEQYDDDAKVKWNYAVDAADLAYILYQVPMMVCVHGSEMLLKK
jgi:hypothetical protein